MLLLAAFLTILLGKKLMIDSTILGTSASVLVGRGMLFPLPIEKATAKITPKVEPNTLCKLRIPTDLIPIVLSFCILSVDTIVLTTDVANRGTTKEYSRLE